MRHEWDDNKPQEGFSTCFNCKLEVKTYRIKKGGLPTCEEVKSPEFIQKKHEKDKAQCLESTPMLSCFKCKGRLDPKICDFLREQGGVIPKKTDIRSKGFIFEPENSMSIEITQVMKI